jgi:uncharacterized repeat protein (TIGR03803 family)
MKNTKFGLGSSLFLKVLPVAACYLALAGTTNAGFVSQGIDPLYPFTGGNDGANPAASLVQATDGLLYGTAYFGGTNGDGTVFQISTDGSFTELYSFTNGVDGANPGGSLIQASNGFLYGTTWDGGTNIDGTVFQISTNGSFTPIYSFTGGNDGADPYCSLVQASDGFLYGTAYYGGTNGDGTVFQISTGGTLTSIYMFTNGLDGANPSAGLIQASDGFLYGTAYYGGTNGDGTIFQISTNGTFTALYSFSGGNDGANPDASLIQASDGYLYGTAQYGGIYGDGTVFQISTNGTFTALYSFSGGNDGADPFGSLIQAADGYLFGTASSGGISGNGTVFAINPNGGQFTALSSFTGGEDGAYPSAGLVQANNGFIYGTAYNGGTNADGTVFVLDALQIAPRTLLLSALSGGPFPAQELTLVNLGATSLKWSVTTSPYENSSSDNGILAPGTIMPLTLTPTAAAASLPPGYYPTTLEFSNLNDGLSQSVQVNFQSLLAPLASFPGSDGANPYSPLIQAGDGNLYGTTVNGGTYGSGTVFRISTNGATTVIYSFTGGNDGGNSYAGLIQASNGFLYGTTEYGGNYGNGTVFQISTDGSLTTLYSFIGVDDGGNPTASLVQANDGNLYGTTSGGAFYGTVFRIGTNGSLTTIYSFTGANDGAYPEAALIQASDGYLYGTASAGGIIGLGTIFQLSLNGSFNPLFSFNGTDGDNPVAALFQAADGYLYGTTTSGNGHSSSGTAFRISTNGAFNSVHLFNGGSDGGQPEAGLIQASDGNLYGTTDQAGNFGYGTIFRISADGSFNTLYSFTGGVDGGNSYASLVQASDGYLYGTSSQDGFNGLGTVFQIDDKGGFTALHSFIGTMQVEPSGALLESGGNLYGTTQESGTSFEGTLFQVTPTGTLTTLYSFFYGTGSGPESGVILAGDGYFYGTTEYGGTFGYGTVFQVSTNGVFTSLYPFTYTNGANPKAALVQASDGYLYGTAFGGGSDGYGTVFQISTNGAFSLLHSFSYLNEDGTGPEAALIQASDGFLYGTTLDGGTNGYGTVFQISTNGAFTSLHSFDYSAGASPVAGLVQASDGNLYGTTQFGGVKAGTVYQITTNGVFTSIYSFKGADGSFPTAGLIQAANGDLYGTTLFGGVSGFGTVFQITTNGDLTSLYSFSGGIDGGNPVGGVAAFDGYLYGLTQSGGANGNGAVFRIAIPSVGALPVTIEVLPFSGGNLTLTFPTVNNQSYTVQQIANLATGNWLTYTNFSGNGSPVQLVIPTAHSATGFFRVTEP